jgi:predicted nucleic acid-binding protein
MTGILRLCLDLNIWCAALLADSKGREGTASQTLVKIVRQGYCLSMPVQLIISWGMLNRLRKVLECDLRVSPPTAELYINTISAYAQLGAIGASPQLTLGGTGMLAMRDIEDVHVLETAIAGKADVVVTANFKDFLSKEAQVLISGQHALYIAPNHRLHIVHPYLMLEWIRNGKIPPLEPMA